MAQSYQVSGRNNVPLPVQINLKIPHVTMDFGHDFVETFLVQVVVMIDSCAALNTTYLLFGIYLCKEYP